MSQPLGRTLLAVALALSAGRLASQEWRGTESVEVRVEDARGRDLEGAEVVFEYASSPLGGPAPMLTDTRGRLAVGGLLAGRWALEVRKPGFMSFRAEIALADGEKPQIVLASQHNVPGAVSTLRVRLFRAKGAPPAPARAELVALPAPAAPLVAATPSTPAPPPKASAPRLAATPPPGVSAESPAAPAPASEPVGGASPAPAASPGPAEPHAVPAPKPVSMPAEPVAEAPATAAPPAVVTPAIRPSPPQAAPAIVDEPSRVSQPAPTPAAPAAPAARVPLPTAPARVTPAAPIARACYECKPGESALLAEGEIEVGGAPCPEDLAERLASVPRADLAALVAGLPNGCAVLVVELPAQARYAGFRYEAAGTNARSEDCLPGLPCPAGSCRFPVEPVIRSEGDSTMLLTLFESTAARRGGFTVYWRRTR